LERRVVGIQNAEPEWFGAEFLQLLVIAPVQTLAFDWLDGEAFDEKALLFRGLEKRNGRQATLNGLNDTG